MIKTAAALLVEVLLCWLGGAALPDCLGWATRHPVPRPFFFFHPRPHSLCVGVRRLGASLRLSLSPPLQADMTVRVACSCTIHNDGGMLSGVDDGGKEGARQRRWWWWWGGMYSVSECIGRRGYVDVSRPLRLLSRSPPIGVAFARRLSPVVL